MKSQVCQQVVVGILVEFLASSLPPASDSLKADLFRSSAFVCSIVLFSTAALGSLMDNTELTRIS